MPSAREVQSSAERRALRHPFIQRSNLRRLDDTYRGDLFLWDIDKTYLDTHFSSVRGLLQIPLEFAIDKEAVPGAVPLLRAIRRGPGERPAHVPLYFVSGSPPQLRRVIEKKMILDGVQFDGITFKDQWGLVRAGRPRGVKEQVGYKLRALLLYRLEMPGPERWTLFGDDAESDAEVFCLFGEVCAGLSGGPLCARLAKARVHKDDIRNIEEIVERVPVGNDPVEKVFIHLYRKSDPQLLTRGPVLPTLSFLQAALVLASDGKIREEAVRAVANDLRRLGRFPEAEIARHADDAVARLGAKAALVELTRP